MYRFCFVILIIFFISCSKESGLKYEYIIKDKSFVENFDLKPNTRFVNLSEGFTFYKQENKESSTIKGIMSSLWIYMDGVTLRT